MDISKSALLTQFGGNDAFLNDLYTQILDRNPDSSGLAFWSQQLLNGVSRDAVVAKFLISSEFESKTGNSTDIITNFYSYLLGRMPDNSGITYWDKQQKNGVSYLQIANTIIASPEFQSRTNIGNPDIVFSRDSAGKEIIAADQAYSLVEGGSSVSIYASLAKKPSSDVLLLLETNSPSDAQLIFSSGINEDRVAIKFSPDNWSTPQSFAVAAKNDHIAETSNQTWKLFAETLSQSNDYHDLKAAGGAGKFSFTTQNSDIAGLRITKDFDVLVTGQRGHIGISLTSKPTSDVYLDIRGQGGNLNIDGLPGYLDDQIKFTPSDWNVEKQVSVDYIKPLLDLPRQSQSIQIDSVSIDQNYTKTNMASAAIPVRTGAATLAIDAGNSPIAVTTNNTILSNIETAVKGFCSFIVSDLNEVVIPFIGKLADKTNSLQNEISNIAVKLIEGSGSGNLEDAFSCNLDTSKFSLVIHNKLPLLNAPVASDLGITGLSMNLDGNVNGNLDYTLTLNGGWDLNNGVYLDQSSSKFSSILGLTGDGLQFNGMLGPLSISAVDQASPNINANRAVGNTGANLAFNLSLKKDADGKLSIPEANKVIDGTTALKETIDINVKGDAQISLGVETKADLPAAFNAVEKFIPSYSFDFTAPFHFNYNAFDKSSTGSSIEASVGKIYLDNTQLNVFQFVRDQIQPAVTAIDDFLKPIFPVVDYLLKGQKPWDISAIGDKIAEQLVSPLSAIPVTGEAIAKGVSQQISEGAQLIENALVQVFTSFDSLNAYDKPDELSKDGLISPYELLRSSANFLYNLAFDRTNTITGVQNTAEASLKQFNASATVISAAKKMIVSLFDDYAPDTQSQRDFATQLKNSADQLGKTLETIQKIEKISAEVKQFQADGVIDLGSYAFDIGLQLVPSQTSVSTLSARSEGILTSQSTSALVDKFNTLISDMKSIGFTFPVLDSITPLVKTIALRQSDFLTFTPDLPTVTVPPVSVPFNVLAAFGIPDAITNLLNLKLDVLLKNSLTLDANPSFGIDNQGIIDWTKSGYSTGSLASILDGFYVKDTNTPEFKMDMTAQLGAVGQIQTKAATVAGVGIEQGLVDVNANAFLRLLTCVSLDVKDGGSVAGVADGKLRPSELVTFAKNGELPFEIYATLKLFADLGFKGVLDIEKIPGPDFLQPTLVFGSDTPTTLPLGNHDFLLGA